MNGQGTSRHAAVSGRGVDTGDPGPPEPIKLELANEALALL